MQSALNQIVVGNRPPLPGVAAVLTRGEYGSQEQLANKARDLATENRSLEVFMGGLQALWHSSCRGAANPNPALASAPGLIPLNQMW